MPAPANIPVSCPKKQELVLRYQQTTRTYADAVAELNQRIGTSSKVDTKQYYGWPKWHAQHRAPPRETLQKHTDEHGC